MHACMSVSMSCLAPCHTRTSADCEGEAEEPFSPRFQPPCMRGAGGQSRDCRQTVAWAISPGQERPLAPVREEVEEHGAGASPGPRPLPPSPAPDWRG